MIKWNLVCLEGHVFYSSEPEKWVGKTCSHKEYDTERKKMVSCKEEMVPYAE